MRRTTVLWSAFPALGDVPSSEEGYLEGREEGLEICFWILTFLVPGVWTGALGQVSTVRGGGWSGRFSFQLKISTVWLGKGPVSVECAVRAGSPQRHDTSGVRNKDFCTRTHAQNHCAMESLPSLG